MKQIIFTTVLIFVIYSAAFAQTENDSCPKIKINAPEAVWEKDENFKVSASFENEKSPSESKFNWIFINDTELIRKFDEKIVEIKTDNTRITNRITIVAGNPDERCRELAMTKVIVIPNIGSPLYFDEYSKLDWNDERARLDSIVIEMEKYKDSELFVWVKFDKNTYNSNPGMKLLKILNHLSMRGFKKNRVTFMISEASENQFKYQPVPQELLSSYDLDEYIRIRGEDLEKITKIF